MTNEDWQHLVIASNEAAMQWYSLVTQKAAPVQPDAIYTPLPGGGSMQVGTSTATLLLIGVVAIAVIVLWK